MYRISCTVRQKLPFRVILDTFHGKAVMLSFIYHIEKLAVVLIIGDLFGSGRNCA